MESLYTLSKALLISTELIKWQDINLYVEIKISYLQRGKRRDTTLQLKVLWPRNTTACCASKEGIMLNVEIKLLLFP